LLEEYLVAAALKIQEILVTWVKEREPFRWDKHTKCLGTPAKEGIISAWLLRGRVLERFPQGTPEDIVMSYNTKLRIMET